MHIILGGTGHVGEATAAALLARGEPVTIVTRNADRGAPWRTRGAGVAVADVHDVASLAAVFRTGRRLFLVNPPADPSTDTDRAERATVAAILAALDGAGLEKIVAQSTYGARPGDRCGDLAVLHEMEAALAAQPIPTTVLRAAYHMTNWTRRWRAPATRASCTRRFRPRHCCRWSPRPISAAPPRGC